MVARGSMEDPESIARLAYLNEIGLTIIVSTAPVFLSKGYF